MPRKKSESRTRQDRMVLAPAQMQAVISSIRQDILESFTAVGPCSIKQIAAELGKPADSIYYHVKKLLKVGLLRHIDTRETKRRDEAIYDVPAEKMRLSYDLDDAENADAVLRIASAMLKRAQKSFQDAIDLDSVQPTGPARNFRVMGGISWLTKADLRQVNRHLNAILQLTGRPRPQNENSPRPRNSRPRNNADQLCSFTCALSPVKSHPLRRGEPSADQ